MYYSIGEVAEMQNVATYLIRFWESEFDIIKTKKNRKGNRQFNKEDIENVKLIYHLFKDRGYTIQGAQSLLKGRSNPLKNKMSHIDSLKKVRSFIVELNNQLP